MSAGQLLSLFRDWKPHLPAIHRGLVRGDGGGAAYQGSKHAVVAISETLSFELARRFPQIRVHVIAPCQVQSNLPGTSVMNRAAAAGEIEEGEMVRGLPEESAEEQQVPASQPSCTSMRSRGTGLIVGVWRARQAGFALTIEAHAQQTFDRM